MRTLLCFLLSLCVYATGVSQTISPAGPINLCPGGSQVLSVTGGGPITAYQWQLGGFDIPGATGTTYTATASGSYSVIINNTAPALPAVTVTLHDNPVANFSFNPNNQCSNVPVTFTNTSTGTGLTYAWNFGDPSSGANNTSTATNPTHEFIGTTGTGTQSFNVSLIVTNSGGCTNAGTAVITTSRVPNTTLNGSGQTTYNGSSYFTSCTASTSTLTFVNGSTTNSTNTNYQIVWGDASPDFNSATMTSTTHTYTLGNYDLLFIVTGNNGCKDTGVYKVFIGSNPAIGFGTDGSTSICSNNSLSFNITGYSSNPPSTTYSVTFNDGTSPTLFNHPPPPSITHQFNNSSCGTNSGSFQNSFSTTISASNPCLSSVISIVPIYVTAKPVATFSISPKDTVCINTNVTVTNTSPLNSNNNNGTCAPGKFVWSVSPATGYTMTGSLGSVFGTDPDLWISGSNSLGFNFTTAGVYTVQLITGNHNCGTDTLIRTICVNELPTGNIVLSQATGCAPLTVTTTTTSNTPFCGTNRYSWAVTYAATAGCTPGTSSFSYQNGTSSTSAEPEFLFNNPGIYTLNCYIIGAAASCSTLLTRQVIVKSKPVVTFGALPASICKDQSVSPTASATCYIDATSTYAWSFPGATPATGTGANPGPIVYTTAGTQTMTLTVTNECGSTTVMQSILVKPTPNVITPADITVCRNPNQGPFTLSSSSPGASFSWTNNNTSIGLPGSGNTATIPVFNPINTTNGPVTATITGTATLNGCSSSSAFTITVRPFPNVSTVANQVVCVGGSTAPITFTGSSVPGTFYYWTNSNQNIGLALSGTGDIPSFVTTNTSNGPLIGTITVAAGTTTSSGLTCFGMQQTFSIRVNPVPSVTDPADIVVCNGATIPAITFTASSVTGTVYNWTNSNTAIGLGASNSGNIPAFTATNSTSSPITSTVTVTPVYTGASVSCPGPPQTFTITVNPAPLVQFSALSQSICSGTSTAEITLTSATAGATITWTAVQPAGITGVTISGTTTIPQQTLINSTTNPITVNYVASATTGGSSTCAGATSTHPVVVNPSPAVTQPADIVKCNGTASGAISFASSTSGATYSWTNDNPSIGLAAAGTGNIASFNVINTGSTPVVANISVTPHFAGCNGTPKSFTITVNPTPSVSQPAAQTVCNGAATTAITFGGSTVTGTTYTWTNSNTAIGLAASGSGDIASFNAINAGNAPVTATITVTPNYSNGGVACTGQVKTFVITVNPTPVVTQPASVTYCNNATISAITFTGIVAGSTYEWTNSDPSIGLAALGSGNIPSFTAINTGSSVVTATITVTPTYGSTACAGTPKTFTISVNPTPSVAQPADQVLCNGNSTAAITFTGSAVTGTTYAWTNNNTSIGLAAAGTGDIASFTATNVSTTSVVATITVTPRFLNGNVLCEGTPKTFTITVSPAPAVQFSLATQTVCSGAATTLVNLSSVTPGATISWTSTVPAGITGALPSGTTTIPSQTLINTTNAPLTVNYVASAVTSGGATCPGATTTHTITVNPVANVIATPAAQTICSGTSTNIALTSAVANTTYSWTVSANAAITGSSAGTGSTIAQALTNNSSTVQSVTYTITPLFTHNNVACPGTPTDVTISVNPVPVIANTVLTQAICTGGSSAAVVFTSAVSGTTYTWTSAASAGVTGNTASGSGNIPVETLFNASNSNGTVTYTITPSANGCAGPSVSYSIIVHPKPSVTNVPLTQTICSGSNSSAVSLTSNVTGATFTWTATATTGITGYLAGGTNNIPAQTISNATAATGTVSYVIIPAANGCPGDPVTYTIQVNPSPAVAFSAAPQVICSGVPTQPVTVTSPTTGAIITWTANQPIGVTGIVQNGTGDIPVQTLINTTNAPVIVNYTASASTGGSTTCPGGASVYTITVNPSPAVQFSEPAQTICSNSVTAVIGITSTTPGVNITWTSTVPTGISGAALSGTNSIPPQQLINNTNGPLTVTYNASAVTTGSASCQGTTETYSITVNPIPTAIGTPATQTICSNTATNIIISSPVPNTTYSWTFTSTGSVTGMSNGNGNLITQVLVNSSAAPQTVTYQVTPVYTNNNIGCEGPAIDIPVTIQPSASINNNPLTQSLCTGTNSLPVTFSSGSAGASYSWTVSNPSGVSGVIASGTGNLPAMPLTIFGTDQATVTYAVTSTVSVCQGPATNYTIVVNPDAVAEFTPTDTMKCPPFAITPSVIGLQQYPNNNSLYEWYANDVLIGTGSSFPGYTIVDENDSVTIKLKTISAFGCKADSTSRKFYTLKLPHPSFELIDTLGCGPLSVVVNNTTPDIALFTYFWNFGNGQTSTAAQPGTITFQPNPTFNDTIYNVSMQIFSVCDTITVTKQVRVKSKPKALFTPSSTTGCSPMVVTFVNTSPGLNSTYYWDFGDGTTFINNTLANVQHTFTTGVTDTFTVKLIAENECGRDSIQYDIAVAPNPIDLNFAVNGPQHFGCAPHTVAFYNNTSGANTFTWNFGDGNTLNTSAGSDTVYHTYLTPGVYNVSLTASNSCTDTTAFDFINVFAIPDAQFIANTYTTCVGLPVNFTNQSTGGSSYLWLFGDGGTSVLTNPSHTYTTAGLYTVQLVVYNATGPGNICTDTITRQVNVLSTLPGSFTMSATTATCAPFTITFINQNQPSVTANWNFGDGTLATGDSVVHTFLNAGVYNVTLTVTVPGGCTYNTTNVVTIGGPDGDLLYTGGYNCSTDPVRFEVSGSNFTSILYDFGDGNTLTTNQLVVFHTYANPGTYIPKVTLQNGGSCNFMVQGLDTVKVDRVDAGYTSTRLQTCGYTRVNFTDTSNIFFGTASVQWNFGDGSPVVTGSNVQHDYSIAGTYSVQMIVTGISGCADTITHPITIAINSQPVADISAPAAKCTGEAVTFNSVIQSTDPVTFQHWLVSNGANGTGSSFAYTFVNNGIYTIRFIAGTAAGCFDTTFHTITINQSPVVLVSADITICRGTSTTLTASGASQYQWSPLQGLSCTTCATTIASPQITTPYIVTGTNAAGCSVSKQVTVTVIQPLNVVVSPNDTICIQQSANLMASGATSYSWSPGTGLSSTTISNPVASPTITTMYRVVGYDGFNCFTDTGYVLVAVGQYPTIDLGPDLNLSSGTTHPLASTVTNGPVQTWLWNPSTDLSCSNCPLPVANIRRDITYIANIKNIYGCAASDTINIKVFCEDSQVFIPNAFSPDGDGINDILMVRGKGILTVKSFRIFNRWGEIVFDKHNFPPNSVTYGWNGKIKGQTGPPDVFMYTAEVICENGSTYTYKGNVSIIK